MSWAEQMKRDAVKIASQGHPFVFRDTDEIELDCEWEEGAYAGSELTGPDPDNFIIEVTVKRDGIAIFDVLYKNEEAARFFMALMRKGGEQ